MLGNLSFFKEAPTCGGGASLRGKNKSFKFYFNGIKQINQIRNKIAHKLDTQITLNDVNFMKPFAEYIRGEKIKEPIEIIEQYTTTICVFLANDISKFGRKQQEEIENIIKSKN